MSGIIYTSFINYGVKRTLEIHISISSRSIHIFQIEGCVFKLCIRIHHYKGERKLGGTETQWNFWSVVMMLI
jgi:hypothetical protein